MIIIHVTNDVFIILSPEKILLDINILICYNYILYINQIFTAAKFSLQFQYHQAL